MIYSTYLHNQLGITLIDTVKETVSIIRKCVKKGLKFDSIAFRGMSGALVAPSVAIALKKSLIIVRKKGERTHSEYEIEGDLGYKHRNGRDIDSKYIIIDDFISKGETVDETIERITLASEGYSRCIAVFTYLNNNQSNGLFFLANKYPDIKIINIEDTKLPDFHKKIVLA